MKKLTYKPSIVLISLLLTGISAFGAEQTLKGVVSDSMCGRKHMMPGKSDAECIRECIKAKSKYALVSGGKIYTLQVPLAQGEEFAGKQVQVTGEVEGATVKGTKISASK